MSIFVVNISHAHVYDPTWVSASDTRTRYKLNHSAAGDPGKLFDFSVYQFIVPVMETIITLKGK